MHSNGMNLQEIKLAAEALEGYTRDMRRALHRIPEIGFQEHKTQAFLIERLAEMGIPYETERTWVIGTIKGERPGKTVALRADIDALPIQEATGLPFSSEHPGFMHACGHDAHTAILLGTAKLLLSMRDRFDGEVRLLFQPAEECDGGAAPMIKAGAMRSVDAVFGLHVAATAPVGRIACRAGAMYAASDMLFLDVFGKSGHGAHPAGGVDAIVIAAQVITAMQTLVTRELEATDAAILTVGMIQGGHAHNILCDHVSIQGTLRTLTPAVRERMIRRLPELAGGIAAAMGGRAEVRFVDGYCACVNDESEAARVLRVAGQLFGQEKTHTLRTSSLGAEDFAYYLLEAPGAIYHLGCGGDRALHNDGFSLDEACLPIGVAMQAALALDFLSTKEASRA